MDFPGSVGKKSACNAGDPGLDSWVRKSPWRRKWLPNPVIPWTEEPSRLQSMGSHGVTRSQHNWANFTCTFKLMRQELACICGQSYLIVCDPMDYSPPDSSVHGIFQARILEQVVISSSRGSSKPKDTTHLSCVSCTGRQILYYWATWEAGTINSLVFY